MVGKYNGAKEKSHQLFPQFFFASTEMLRGIFGIVIHKCGYATVWKSEFSYFLSYIIIWKNLDFDEITLTAKSVAQLEGRSNITFFQAPEHPCKAASPPHCQSHIGQWEQCRDVFSVLYLLLCYTCWNDSRKRQKLLHIRLQEPEKLSILTLLQLRTEPNSTLGQYQSYSGSYLATVECRMLLQWKILPLLKNGCQHSVQAPLASTVRVDCTSWMLLSPAAKESNLLLGQGGMKLGGER